MTKSFGLAALLLAAVAPATGCIITSSDDAACDDGVDNDGDGLVDGSDPGCSGPEDDSEADNVAACDDGDDNDGDGLVDGDDPGCSGPTDDDETDGGVAACADETDNDGDGLVDGDDPGCTSATDGDESNPALAATWTVTEGDPSTVETWSDEANFTEIPCPGGFATLRLISRPIDGAGEPNGTDLIDLFDCADGAGEASLPVGRFRIWAEITNADGSDVYAQSGAAVLDLSGDGTFAAEFVDNGGYFSFQWLLNNGNEVTCETAGAASVSILSTITGTASAFEDLYTCTDGAAVTSKLPHDSYEISIAALDGGDLSIGTAPVISNRVIDDPNEFVELGAVTIPLD